jgi:hypothetical protein
LLHADLLSDLRYIDLLSTGLLSTGSAIGCAADGATEIGRGLDRNVWNARQQPPLDTVITRSQPAPRNGNIGDSRRAGSALAAAAARSTIFIDAAERTADVRVRSRS